MSAEIYRRKEGYREARMEADQDKGRRGNPIHIT